MKNYPIILDEISEYIQSLQQQNEQLIKQQQVLVNLVCANTKDTMLPNIYVYSGAEGCSLVVTDLETGETSSFSDDIGYSKHPAMAVMDAVKFYVKWDGEN